MMYHVLVLPLFDYMDTVYDGLSKYWSQKLEVTQNRACRIITGKGLDTHTNDLRNMLNLKKMDDRRQDHLYVYMYKVRHELLPKSQLEMFSYVSDSSTRSTRASVRMDFAIPKTNLHITDKCICVRGPRGEMYYSYTFDICGIFKEV